MSHIYLYLFCVSSLPLSLSMSLSLYGPVIYQQQTDRWVDDYSHLSLSPSLSVYVSIPIWLRRSQTGGLQLLISVSIYVSMSYIFLSLPLVISMSHIYLNICVSSLSLSMSLSIYGPVIYQQQTDRWVDDYSYLSLSPTLSVYISVLI